MNNNNEITTVYCLAENEPHAHRIYERLIGNGVPDSDISLLYADDGRLSHRNSTKTPEGTAIGSGTGGALGGVIGWLAGIGLLAIPGVGPFAAAGPIMAALSGAAIGAAAGGLAGALIGLGIPEYEAGRYQQGLEEGKLLLAIQAVDSTRADRIDALVKEVDAKDISRNHTSGSVANQVEASVR